MSQKKNYRSASLLKPVVTKWWSSDQHTLNTLFPSWPWNFKISFSLSLRSITRNVLSQFIVIAKLVEWRFNSRLKGCFFLLKFTDDILVKNISNFDLSVITCTHKHIILTQTEFNKNTLLTCSCKLTKGSVISILTPS